MKPFLNKGYFEHKMLSRSNACGLVQVSEEVEGRGSLMKRCWRAHAPFGPG